MPTPLLKILVLNALIVLATHFGCLANLTALDYLQVSKGMEIKGLELLKRPGLRIHRQ